MSGTNGLVSSTIDGGFIWRTDSVDGAYDLDFRSIKAFDENTAVIVSAGTPASIYKTTDGGISWKLCWFNDDPAVFLDAVAFWDRERGLVMGDPVDGSIFLLSTTDGGISWQRIAQEGMPKSLESEGGFAASGTCLAFIPDQFAWFATGGDAARVYRSEDSGQSWEAVNTPILSGSPMKGIYSLSFKNELEGVAVGGEWNISTPERSKAYTRDGGKTWTLGTGADTYCSGSCFVNGNIFLACGQSGIDISEDGGTTWRNINETHLYGLSFEKSGETGYGTGPSGKVIKLNCKKN